MLHTNLTPEQTETTLRIGGRDVKYSLAKKAAAATPGALNSKKAPAAAPSAVKYSLAGWRALPPPAAPALRPISPGCGGGWAQQQRAKTKSLAWLGDCALDFYLALKGCEAHITARDMVFIHDTLFSNKVLARSGELATIREAAVGKAVLRYGRRMEEIMIDILDYEEPTLRRDVDRMVGACCLARPAHELRSGY